MNLRVRRCAQAAQLARYLYEKTVSFVVGSCFVIGGLCRRIDTLLLHSMVTDTADSMEEDNSPSC